MTGGAPPLAGLRVLDLSRLLPGGYATMVLADLGADVVKVEEPGRGDYLRWFPPFTSSGLGGPHLALNRGKRSITVDLKHPAGRQVLRDLARGADVLVESFRPGVLDRLGVGYAELAAVNPKLVWAAISGYGATGPRVAEAGHDINYLAVAGALSFSGYDRPQQPSLQIGDLGGGAMSALVAVLVALRVRDQTGRGQFCDVSMTDGVLSWLSVHAGELAAGGPLPGPGAAALNGGLACYRTYVCADGRYVAVGALESKFFERLVAALGVPELASWQLAPDRQVELAERLGKLFAARPRDDWAALLGPADCCVTPVLDLAEALAAASRAGRGMVVDTVLPDGSPFPQLGVVPRLADTPGQVGGPPSELGADTDAVLAEAGYSAERVAELRAAGAV